MSPLAERMAPVTARLSRLRGAIRTLFALDGVSRLFLALAAFVVATFLLDWSLILPTGVRLTAYSGDAGNLPAPVLQRYLDAIAAGTLSLGPSQVYPLERIRDAHRDVEANAVTGKPVVLTA